MRGEGVGKIPNIPEGLGWRNAEAVERRVRADWELVRKRAD